MISGVNKNPAAANHLPESRPNTAPSMGLASWALVVWSLAFPEPAFPVNALMAPSAATPPSPPNLLFFAVCMARAFPMTGQRRAMVCRLDILPPPGEAWRAGVVVERERRVAGQVFFKNGQTALDWRRTASMVAVAIDQ